MKSSPVKGLQTKIICVAAILAVLSLDVARSAFAAGEGQAKARSGTREPGKQPGKLATPSSDSSSDDAPVKPWAKLTDDEQAASVKELKAFAETTTKFKDGSLRLLETRYFLFYTDLKPQEAQNWAGLLDRMYGRLADLFAVTKGTNIWRGKALVFVFSKPEDYRAFEKVSHKTDAGETAGMCHSYSTGYVHIAFYRQPQELEFAHVLVHESVHGFIHRYRSAVNVPSWANEGLAEVIASELVPQNARANQVRGAAQGSMRQRGVGEDFYTTDHIAGWQYPVAESLCTFMIGQSKAGYVAFINAVKDGMAIDEAMEKKYGAGRDRVTAAFLDSMGVRNRAVGGLGNDRASQRGATR